MAARATKDSVQRAVEGPDFDAALAIINGRIADGKEAQSQAGGRVSQAWGDVEKTGVNKRGAQMFMRVQGIEDDAERQDQLRTFFELCKREGIGLEVDLVDQAQGKTEHPVPVQPTGTPAPAGDAPAAPAPAAGDKLDAKPAAKAKATKPGEDGKVVGIDAARKHLGTDKTKTAGVPDATD